MESGKRITLSPGYHAEPGPAPGHQHDIYVATPSAEGVRRHVGTLTKAAVEAWVSSPVEMATALLFALGHDDDKDVADFLRDWMSGDTSRWFEFKPKYRAALAEKAIALAARPAAPEAQGAWMPIETAPQTDEDVLVAASYWDDAGNEHRYTTISSYLDQEGRRGYRHRNGAKNATDWMPLPAPTPAPPSSGQGGR